MKRLGIVLAAGVVVFLLSGCALFELKDDLTEFDSVYGINGKIYEISADAHPILVVLYGESHGQIKVADYSIPDPAGHYSFLVSEGVYYVAAFEDFNRDFAYTEGETYGYAMGSAPVVVDAAQMAAAGTKAIRDLEIRLTEKSGYRSDFPLFVDIHALPGQSYVNVGVVTDLDDPLFAQENGYKGYWKPFSFLRDIGVGIYFIEPYDPDRIPLLFVHGVNGTPIGFKPIVENMDRSRYQAWFYYYPSGFRLDAVAGALNLMIQSLHEDYGFERMAVAAHSMGGLVSRAFVMKNAVKDRHAYIQTLITMSTPWGGVRAAQSGVDQAPVVVPNWYDVSPDSEFIADLYEKPLPSQVRFYLLFGVRGKCSVMMGSNDGTIEIASELDYRAQRDAARLFGFDEDHESILSSKIVVEQFHRILSGVFSGTRHTGD